MINLIKRYCKYGKCGSEFVSLFYFQALPTEPITMKICIHLVRIQGERIKERRSVILGDFTCCRRCRTLHKKIINCSNQKKLFVKDLA